MRFDHCLLYGDEIDATFALFTQGAQPRWDASLQRCWIEIAAPVPDRARRRSPAVAAGCEGIVSKRALSNYWAGDTRDWLKIKPAEVRARQAEAVRAAHAKKQVGARL